VTDTLTDLIDAHLAKANAATQGDWAHDGRGNVYDPSVSAMHDDPRIGMASDNDAAHIAANDPATIEAFCAVATAAHRLLHEDGYESELDAHLAALYDALGKE
jgi:hypothetical protein